MLGYNEIYELLRKEKFSETLQPLPKKFLDDFKEYVSDKKDISPLQSDVFSENATKLKKQFENSVALFREVMLKRKRKILNLVFVATETGILKRDYENMLPMEKETFDKMVKSYEECDKELAKYINGEVQNKNNNKLILFKENIDKFVSHDGHLVGPFKTGEATNIENDIADILISSGKASLIDES